MSYYDFFVDLLKSGQLELSVHYFVLTSKANERLNISKDKAVIELSFELIPHSDFGKEVAKHVTAEDVMKFLTQGYYKP